MTGQTRAHRRSVWVIKLSQHCTVHVRVRRRPRHVRRDAHTVRQYEKMIQAPEMREQSLTLTNDVRVYKTQIPYKTQISYKTHIVCVGFL